jgi:Cu/Ag efflux protein CusF
MKTRIRSCLTLLALASAALLSPACSKTGESTAVAAPANAEAKRYALKGVIVEVQTVPSALLVKHEDIPGLMPAMTMLFKVDAATLKASAKGQAITATLVQRDDGFWLEKVKLAQ